MNKKMASTNNHSLSSSSEALSDMSADEGNKAANNNTSDNQENNRIASLEQQNRVLKMELEMYKLRCKQMKEENKGLRQASVSIVSIIWYPAKALILIIKFALNL